MDKARPPCGRHRNAESSAVEQVKHGSASSSLRARPADNCRLARQGLVDDGFRRGDPETGPDKGRQEAVKVHVREPRHAMIAARGLGEITDTGHRVRIIVKCFIKVPNAQVEE